MKMHSDTLGSLEIEELILSCKPLIERLAWKAVALDRSRGFTLLEFDDYVQVGMLGMYEAASHLEQCTTTPSRYLYGAAHRAMIDEYRNFFRRGASVSDTLSLNVPLSFDTSTTFADVLLDRSSSAHSCQSTKRTRVLHGALKRLTGLRRDAVKRVYGFEGQGDNGQSSCDMACELGISRSAFDLRHRDALEALRKDAQLCLVMGVEVPPEKEHGSRGINTGATARAHELFAADPSLSTTELSKAAQCQLSIASLVRKEYQKAHEIEETRPKSGTARARELFAINPSLSTTELAKAAQCQLSTASTVRKQYLYRKSHQMEAVR